MGFVGTNSVELTKVRNNFTFIVLTYIQSVSNYEFSFVEEANIDQSLYVSRGVQINVQIVERKDAGKKS